MDTYYERNRPWLGYLLGIGRHFLAWSAMAAGLRFGVQFLLAQEMSAPWAAWFALTSYLPAIMAGYWGIVLVFATVSGASEADTLSARAIRWTAVATVIGGVLWTMPTWLGWAVTTII